MSPKSSTRVQHRPGKRRWGHLLQRHAEECTEREEWRVAAREHWKSGAFDEHHSRRHSGEAATYLMSTSAHRFLGSEVALLPRMAAQQASLKHAACTDGKQDMRTAAKVGSTDWEVQHPSRQIGAGAGRSGSPPHTLPAEQQGDGGAVAPQALRLEGAWRAARATAAPSSACPLHGTRHGRRLERGCTATQEKEHPNR